MSKKTPNPFQGSSVSMYRQTNGIWRAGFDISDGNFFTQATGSAYFGKDNSAAQPRLKEVLDLLDAKKMDWFSKPLTDAGDFIVSWYVENNSKIIRGIVVSKAELTIEAYQAALRQLKTDSYAGMVSAKNALKDTFAGKLNKYNLQWERLPGNRDWLIWGTAVVVDGDTIHVTITDRGEALRDHPEFEPGDIAKIRFVGIDTAETKKDNAQYDAEGRNSLIAKKYKIPLETAYDLANQGKKATSDIMHVAGSFVVVDIDVKNGLPKPDTLKGGAPGGRWIGVVYKSLYDPALAADPMSEDDWYINVNKTLIASPSNMTWIDTAGRSRAIPLASVKTSYAYDLNDTKFDAITWEHTAALDAELARQDIEKDAAEGEALLKKQAEEEIAKLRYNNGKTTREVETYIVKGDETLAAIVKEYQSRNIPISENLLVTVNNLQSDGKGGYILTKGMKLYVPIIKPVVDTGEGSFKLEYGHMSDNSLDFFTPVDDRREMTSPYHLRIGDVQLVIPPLSIDVNQVSSIQKVKTLRTKSSVITKAGSTHTTLTLQLYFHDLETINGYRVRVSNSMYDYYMDGLRPLIAQFKKAPFLPIQNEYINETLDIHEICLVNLNIATVPGFPHSLAATLTLTKFDPEAYMPQIEFLDNWINYPMFRWYYQQPMTEINRLNPYRTYLAPIEEALNNDFHFTIANEDDLIARIDAAKDLRFLDAPLIFDDKVSQGKNLLGRMQNDAVKMRAAIAQRDRYLQVKKELGNKFPKTFSSHSDVYERIYGKDFKLSASDSAYLPIEWADPSIDREVYLVKLEAETNINGIPSQLVKDKKRNTYQFSTLSDSTETKYVDLILKNGTSADTEIKAYKYNYKKLQEKSQGTEGYIKMEDYYISDAWITSMNVTYENSFSMVQTQTGAHPTYQYLGSQDPYIQLTMETSERATVQSIQNLIHKADEYSLKYRYGITSGFVGFENQLSRLFGVTSVMIENCTIRTVPGFANRFQIDMVLCGFNKTQKRSESLDGVVGTDMTNKADRHVTKDPTQSDAIIIERKMKDLELYPDMELPTYKELNEVLPYISAGITMYHNQGGAKYVDPDFYISTNGTYRNYFTQFKDTENKDENLGLIQLQDFAGMIGKMRVNSDKYFEPDGESEALFDNIDARARTVVIKDTGYTPPIDFSAMPTNLGVPGLGPLPGSSWNPFSGIASDQKSVKTWASDYKNIFTPPSSDLLGKWSGVALSPYDSSSAQRRLTLTAENFIKQPSHLDVYKEIYQWVDKLWVDNGHVYDDRTIFDNNVKKVTYATVEDVAKASYTWLKYSGDQRFASAPAVGDGKDLTYADLNHTKGMITRERWANYIKAMLDLENGWKQFDQSGGRLVPSVNPTAPAAGIGQIMLSIHPKNVEEAQRLAWDWKYNIEWAMHYLFEQWVRATKSNDIGVRSRPWDWAVRWYNLPGANVLASKDPRYSYDDGRYWPVVMTRFQGPTNKTDQKERVGAWYNAEISQANSPGRPNNPEIFAFINNLSSANVALIKNDRGALIKRLLDYNTYLANVRHQPGFTQKELEGWTTEKLIAKYEEISKEILTQYKGNIGINDSIQATYVEFQETTRALKTNLLLNADMPNALWRDMFTDMIEYDHRGRLLRGFPTFQMFIIDEGRWMANYKLWDNLYGFNAIESIDVHKSRKIAADTAVIRMTNVYSNLTSRKLDESYGDWKYNIWDNLFLGNPTQQLIDARKELVSSMMLETGARIHLRMGYGSDATSLPVMFNGTITELDSEDVVTIVAQGDGIELTNIISADPKETNDGVFRKVLEPRDMLCKLMTSKGNWFKNVVNNLSGGDLFKDHPLGIQHFGNPVKTPDANASPGAIFNWYPDGSDFGEAVQNIYSSNGENTFSQWTREDGTEIDGNFWSNLLTLSWPEGDEADIKLKLYGQTVWDVAQTLAYCSPDYIAAVHPFEMRSTLFFGKPYYKLAYRYDSLYSWDENALVWKRQVTSELRKPYQQFHMYMSDTDILSNRIKTSEEGVYTNVVANVDGSPTMMQMADEDIRFDKQKTKVVDTNLVADWKIAKFFTSDKQGEYYAQSTLRDYIKDMYKGTLTVLGDPTVKPHDMCYLQDSLHDMNGSFLVKDVTHSFSMETGFITMISPDAVVVIDDVATIAQSSWLNSACIGAASYFMGRKLASRALRKLVGSSTMLGRGAQWTTNAAGKAMLRLASSLPHDKNDVDYNVFKDLLKNYSESTDPTEQQRLAGKIEQQADRIHAKLQGINADTKAKKLGNASRKGLVSLSKGIASNLKQGRNALAFLRVGGLASGIISGGITILATLAMTIISETLHEAFRRRKKARQAVMIVPLRYQGRNFTAGLNGAAGSVVGTKPGKMDQFYMGAGYGGQDGWTKVVGKTLNFLFDGDGLTGNSIDWITGAGDPFGGTVDYEINTPDVDNAWNDNKPE